MTIICGATALYNHERWWLWGPRFPDCVKTPTSGLRVESLSRLRRITKEPLWQSPSKEEKRENNSAHSLLVHVFTQPVPEADILGCRNEKALSIEPTLGRINRASIETRLLIIFGYGPHLGDRQIKIPVDDHGLPDRGEPFGVPRLRLPHPRSNHALGTMKEGFFHGHQQRQLGHAICHFHSLTQPGVAHDPRTAANPQRLTLVGHHENQPYFGVLQHIPKGVGTPVPRGVQGSRWCGRPARTRSRP